MKCEACGNHPVAYFVDSWVKKGRPRKMCCVCVDRMVTRIPNIKNTLNITEIPQDDI